MSRRPKILKPATHRAAIEGQVLARLRSHAGLSQGEMAEEMGLSQPVWSRIERGEAALTTVRLHRAAEILETTAGAIVDQVDRVEADAARRGVEVSQDRPTDWLMAGVILVGVAAVAALVAALLDDD